MLILSVHGRYGVVETYTLLDAWQASGAQEIRRHKNLICHIRCEHFFFVLVRVRRVAQASSKKTTNGCLNTRCDHAQSIPWQYA